MFGLEALELARVQFAFTITFHIIFPAITIGLASYLAVLEALWLKTKQEVYRDLDPEAATTCCGGCAAPLARSAVTCAGPRIRRHRR
ncbi:cytochrome ubiquinol oxidase subunit I, partial [Streptococcus pneumoniae]|uniref:cytochrome ubiquinol oxidase subunit I n=1 Tax=Streptococcus pneumoniae TaxID=1313 RepID=UPI0018E2F3E6